MKIIKPSAKLLGAPDEIEERLEYCGRICYRSESKPGSAPEFLRKIVARGHWSVLEMADLSVVVDTLDVYPTKYLEITEISGGGTLITGSVRAFREWFLSGIDRVAAPAICTLFKVRYPVLFDDLSGVPGCRVDPVHPKWLLTNGDISLEDYQRHHRAAVEFVVNRAVSHEIVRHRPCSFLQESQRYCRYDDDVEFIEPVFWGRDSLEYSDWWSAMTRAERDYKALLRTSSPQAARTVLPNSTATRLLVYANLQEWKHIFKLRDSAAADPSMREVMHPLRGSLFP